MFMKPVLCVDYFNFLFCRGYVYVGASIGARSTLAQQMAQARAAALVLAALPSAHHQERAQRQFRHQLQGMQHIPGRLDIF